jgi:hypothetical protein
VDFQRFLTEIELHRIQFWVTLYDKDGLRSSDVNLIVDTGSANTLISQNLADMFSMEKVGEGHIVTLGGRRYTAEGTYCHVLNWNQVRLYGMLSLILLTLMQAMSCTTLFC